MRRWNAGKRGRGWWGESRRHSLAAKKGWRKRVAKMPRVPMKTIEAAEALRPKRARVVDRAKRAKVVLDPDDPRVNFWLKRPYELDVEGIDTPVVAKGRDQPEKNFEKQRELSVKLKEKIVDLFWEGGRTRKHNWKLKQIKMEFYEKPKPATVFNLTLENDFVLGGGRYIHVRANPESYAIFELRDAKGNVLGALDYRCNSGEKLLELLEKKVLEGGFFRDLIVKQHAWMIKGEHRDEEIEKLREQLKEWGSRSEEKSVKGWSVPRTKFNEWKGYFRRYFFDLHGEQLFWYSTARHREYIDLYNWSDEGILIRKSDIEKYGWDRIGKFLEETAREEYKQYTDYLLKFLKKDTERLWGNIIQW
jgi:hypothetical protein